MSEGRAAGDWCRLPGVVGRRAGGRVISSGGLQRLYRAAVGPGGNGRDCGGSWKGFAGVTRALGSCGTPC